MYVNFDTKSLLPERTGKIKKIFIKNKLEKIGMPIKDLSLGEFDFIGEYTAKKTRSPDSEHFRTAGCFFRPNYERGLLIYSLIKKYNIESFLEIGFGRGYGALCAAKAMQENDKGEVYTIDPSLDAKFIEHLSNIYPKEWFERMNFFKGKSSQVYEEIADKRFDFIYIDGDHTYQGVKVDWEFAKDRFNKFILFDDYHLPSSDGSDSTDIECAHLIDEIEDESKELILMDRRIFFDDRRVPDKDINYGQVLLTHESLRK